MQLTTCKQSGVALSSFYRRNSCWLVPYAVYNVQDLDLDCKSNHWPRNDDAV